MSGFSCFCQNYHGTLSVAEKGCVFSAPQISITLEWGNVKKVNLDTKLIKGVPTSVLVFQLDKAQDAIETTETMSNATSSSKRYLFYGFTDMLTTQDTIKSMWAAYRASAKADRAAAAGTAVSEREDSKFGAQYSVELPADASAVAPSGAPGSPQVRTTSESEGRQSQSRRNDSQRRAAASAGVVTTLQGSQRLAARSVERIYSGALCVCDRCGIPRYVLLAAAAVLLLLVLVLAPWLGMRALAAPKPQDLVQTTRLLDRLAAARRLDSKVRSFSSTAQFAEYEHHKHLAHKESAQWIRRLENAADEIVQLFVSLQLDMLSLRQRRLERLAATTATRRPAAARGASADGGSHVAAAAAASRRRSRGVSMSKVADDLHQWASRIARAARLLRRAAEFVWRPWRLAGGGGAPASRGGGWREAERQLTEIYSEELFDGHLLSQRVTPAEKRDREECLRLSRALLSAQRTSDKVFTEFFNTLLLQTAEQFGKGHKQPHYWGNVPAALASPALQRAAARHIDFQAFSAEELLRIAYIRRHLAAIFVMDARERNEFRRRDDALARAESAAALVAATPPLGTRARGGGSSLEERSRRAAAFLDVLPGGVEPETDGREAARNIAAEIAFWEREQSLWIEHVLDSMSAEQRVDLAQLLAATRNLTIAATSPYWRPPASHRSSVSSLGAGADGVNAGSAGIPQTAGENRTSRLEWGNVPAFKGLLCFQKKPTVSIVADALLDAKSPPDGDQKRPRGSQGPREFGYVPRRRQAAQEEEEATTAAPSLLLKDSHIRNARTAWVNELAVFRMALRPAGSGSRRNARLFALEDADASMQRYQDVRWRLFTILNHANQHYVTPYFVPLSGGVLRWARRWLWPPSLLSRIVFGSHDSTADLEALRMMGRQDPAVDYAMTQVLGLPWGNQKDAPYILMNNILLQPPELLQMRLVIRKKIVFAWVVLTTAVVLLYSVSFCF